MLVLLLDAHGPRVPASARRILFDALERASSPHRLGLAFVPFLRDHDNVTGVQGRARTTSRGSVRAALPVLRFGPPSSPRCDHSARAKATLFARPPTTSACSGTWLSPMWTNFAEAIEAVVTGSPLTGARCCAPLGRPDSSHAHRFLLARALAGTASYARRTIFRRASPPRSGADAVLAFLGLRRSRPARRRGCRSQRSSRRGPRPRRRTTGPSTTSTSSNSSPSWPAAAATTPEPPASPAPPSCALRHRHGLPIRRPTSWLDDAATAATTGAAWADGITDGRGLTLPQASAYAARGRGSRHRPTIGWDSLTPTETDVVDLVAQGLTNRQIAERLLIGVATVKTHISHVFNKLSVTTRTELAAALQQRRRHDRPVDRQPPALPASRSVPNSFTGVPASPANPETHMTPAKGRTEGPARGVGLSAPEPAFGVRRAAPFPLPSADVTRRTYPVRTSRRPAHRRPRTPAPVAWCERRAACCASL